MSAKTPDVSPGVFSHLKVFSYEHQEEKMSRESIFNKIRKKVDKEYAEELRAEALAEKERKKQEAIAAYKTKRTLTVEKFFEAAGLKFPSSLGDIRDCVISGFTADPKRLDEKAILMYWGGPQSSKYDYDALALAQEKNCLLIITDTPCDYHHTLFIGETDETGESLICSAYIRASHYIKSLHKAKVIAVTGSVGKTSTKEMIESVLRQHYKAPLISRGNKNSMFAVTENIQNLKRTTAVYLQEVGANTHKVVEISARQLEADIAVYTNIGHSHIENYGSQEAIASDKLSLSRFGKSAGVAIINYDDEILRSHRFTQKVITYSLNNPAAMFYAVNIDKNDGGYDFTLVDSRGKTPATLSARINVLGEHNILNAAAAFAVGTVLGLDEDEILAGIAAYRPSGMRQNLIEPGGYHVFADCYNSSLISVNSSLDTMDAMTLPAPGGRRIAVLGDVLELGDISAETHRQIGRAVAAHNVDLFLGYGKNIKLAVDEAAVAGKDARYFDRKKDMEEVLRNTMTTDDIILFKASHGINLGSSIDCLFGTDMNERSIIGQKLFRLETHGDFEYYIFEDSVSVKRYLGEDPEPQVPPFIETAPFSLESDESGIDCDINPQTARLTVEKIGRTAFRGMTQVKRVTLPEGLVTIRAGAFKGSGLTELDAPHSLLSVGDEAFADCPDLTKVVLPESIFKVGEQILENSPFAVIEYKK